MVLSGGVQHDRTFDGDVVADFERRHPPGIRRGAGHAVVGELGGGRRRTRRHREDRLIAGAGRGPVALRAERIVGDRRIGARHTHREAGLALHRRVVFVDHEAAIVAGGAAEAADRIVETDARTVGDAGRAADAHLTSAVVDEVDEALMGHQRELVDEQQAGDIVVADAVALHRQLERERRLRRVVQRQAGLRRAVGRRRLGEELGPRQRRRRHLENRVPRNDHLVVVDGDRAAAERIGARVHGGGLNEAGHLERRRRRHRQLRPQRGHRAERRDSERRDPHRSRPQPRYSSCQHRSHLLVNQRRAHSCRNRKQTQLPQSEQPSTVHGCRTSGAGSDGFSG